MVGEVKCLTLQGCIKNEWSSNYCGYRRKSYVEMTDQAATRAMAIVVFMIARAFNAGVFMLQIIPASGVGFAIGTTGFFGSFLMKFNCMFWIVTATCP